MSSKRRSTLLTLAALLASPLHAATVNYIGTNTLWSSGPAWSTGSQPAAADNVFILPFLDTAQTNTLTLNSTATINSLFLGSTGPGNMTLALALGTLNASSFNLLPGGAITGNGTLTGTFNNAGSLLFTKVSLFLPANSTSTNANVLNTLTGGSLSLASTSGTAFIDNTNGTILSSGTASITITNISISGGSLSTDPSAQIHLFGNSSLADLSAAGNLFLDGPTSISNALLAGNISQNPANPATLSGTITSNANWSNASLLISTPTALNGNGTLSLANTSSAIAGNSTLSIGPAQILQGNGTISGITLTNFGTLRVSNGNLSISTTQSTFTNAGTLLVGLGGNLTIDNNSAGIIDNTNGTFSATNNGSIQIADHVISGGTFSTSGAAQIVFTAATVSDASLAGTIYLDSTTLLNDSLSGNITLNGANCNLGGNIALNGTLNLGSNIHFSSDLALTGNGTTTLTNFGDITGSPSCSFTVAASHTLSIPSGNPLLTIQTGASFINAGTTRAQGGTFEVVLPAPSTGLIAATNSGTLSASSGRLIFFGAGGPASPSTFDNTSGLISSTGAGVIQFTDVNLFGGQLSGSITFQGTLSDASVAGTLSLSNNTLLRNDSFSGSVFGPSFQTVSLSGTLSGDALWNVRSLQILDATTLAGSRAITFFGNITCASPASLSIAPAQTLQGAGAIGQLLSNLSLNNSGTILANVPAAPLTLFLPGFGLTSFTNAGTIVSINGASLRFTGSGPAVLLDNSNGTLSASGTASSLTLSSLAISGGLITSTPDASILLNNTTLSRLQLSGNISSNSSLSFQSVTLNGTFAQAPATTVTLSGSFTNNANWTNANISIPQTLTINGVAGINLANTSISSTSPGTAVLTTAPTITIAGSGAIGSGFSAFFNNGLLWANLPGGNLTISCPLINPGDIAIVSAANMTLSAPVNTTGTFDVNGNLTINANTTGAITETGAGNLTFNGTYTTSANSTFSAGLVSFNSGINAIGRVFGNATIFADVGSGSSAGLIADGIQAANLSLKGSVRIRTNGTSSGTSKLGILQNAPSGLNGWLYNFDITNNKLVVEPTPATRATALANIRSQVAYGTTHAAGITSTNLPAHTVLAVIDNANNTLSTFGGLPVDANSILVAPELPGDANIDGSVDLSDLAIVLNHFGKPTLNWLDGNFGNAATIDSADLNAVLNNFGLINPLALSAPAGAQPAIPTPEPATALLLLAPPLLFLRRRVKYLRTGV